MNPIPLKQYIKEHIGTQRMFAAQMGVKPAQVTQWINQGCVVIDKQMFFPRYDLPEQG